MSVSSITNETSLEKVCELYNLPSRVRAGGGVTSSVELLEWHVLMLLVFIYKY